MIGSGVRANSSLAGGEPTRPGKVAALAVSDLMALSFSWAPFNSLEWMTWKAALPISCGCVASADASEVLQLG
jgi:hypothetical protein